MSPKWGLSCEECVMVRTVCMGALMACPRRGNCPQWRLADARLSWRLKRWEPREAGN